MPSREGKYQRKYCCEASVSVASMQFPTGEACPLPISSISHLSRVVRDVEKSSAFYTNVLGFVPVRRPSSFDFEGSWVSAIFSLLGVPWGLCASLQT